MQCIAHPDYLACASSPLPLNNVKRAVLRILQAEAPDRHGCQAAEWAIAQRAAVNTALTKHVTQSDSDAVKMS